MDQGLGLIHDLGVRRRWPAVRKGLLNLGAKPGVIGVRVDREAGRQRALSSHASEQDAHRTGDRQPGAASVLSRSSTRTWSMEMREAVETVLSER